MYNAHYYILLLHINTTLRRRSNCAMCLGASIAWMFRRLLFDGNEGRLRLGKCQHETRGRRSQFSWGDSAACGLNVELAELHLISANHLLPPRFGAVFHHALARCDLSCGSLVMIKEAPYKTFSCCCTEWHMMLLERC